MGQLEGFGLIFTAILALALVGLGWWWRNRNVKAEQNFLQSQVRAERDRADLLGADAARLPDALGRATRSEEGGAALNEALRDAAAREAGLAAQLADTQRFREQLVVELAESEKKRTDLHGELDTQRQVGATATATSAAKQEEVSRLTTDLSDAYKSLETARKELEMMSGERAQAVAQRDAATTVAEDSRSFLKEAQEKLRSAFTEAASTVFDQKAALLDSRIQASGEASKEGLVQTLKPFAEQVGKFQSRIEQLASDDARERATLVGTIGELKTLNQDMADATNAMTKALKGNAKARGDWGEMILETVLKASGLEEGTHFVSQANTKDDDTGRQQRPDVVVMLPDGRQIVVDSKVNLVAWAEANQAETLEAQQDALIRHAAALRLHMRDLSDKNYPKNLGGQTLDTTVLFVPIEGALSVALSVNKELQTEAFAKRIVFASPNTLMAMLRVCERLWTRDKLHKQIDVIGTQAGLLIDSISLFIEEFDDVGTRISNADTAFRQAKNRLNESPQSVMARARRLVASGAKGKKDIPAELQPELGETILALPSNTGPTEP
jgi:DNA recombination protein RmuC